MNKITLAASVVCLCASSLNAENNISEVLNSIENNNTTLKAIKETAESEKIGNLTDIYLADPEIEFNYLWGSPTVMANRTDIRVSQQLDYATLAGKKRALADQQNILVDLQYKQERLNILTEAKQLCIDLVYYNALIKALETRQTQATEIVAVQKRRLDAGEGTQLEYNNVQIALGSIEGEMASITAERNAVLENLTRLNGGEKVSLSQSAYTPAELPADFDSWYATAEVQSPVLAYVKQEIEISQKDLNLKKALSVPSLTVGYMSENTMEQKFNGVTLGLSIPLWSNKNKIKQAKSAITAAELRASDSKLQFYSQLKILYNKTIELRKAADKYQESLSKADNSNLLKKAYNEGQISLLDYLLQMGFYYDATNQILSAERDYQKSYAELTSISL